MNIVRVKYVTALSLIFGILLTTHTATATSYATCHKVWELERELGCGPSPHQPPTPDNKKHSYVIISQFGPSICKATQSLSEVKKDLKSECQNWLNERKADLGSKYNTGTCEEKCEPCPQGLQKCTYSGMVHYNQPQ